MITSKASIISAAVYELKGRVYVCGYSITTVGLRQNHGPVYEADKVDIAGIGEAVIQALNGCQEGIPHPSLVEQGKEKGHVAEAAKVKNGHQLMKNSLLVNVFYKNGVLEYWPTKFCGTMGPNRGFKPIKDRIISSPVEPEAIGQAVLQALASSENPWRREK